MDATHSDLPLPSAPNPSRVEELESQVIDLSVRLHQAVAQRDEARHVIAKLIEALAHSSQ